MKKLDINNLKSSEITARLFSFIQNFDIDKYSDSNEIKAHCKILVIKNFTYDIKMEQTLIYNLCLFLLGNKENCFNRFLKS